MGVNEQVVLGLIRHQQEGLDETSAAWCVGEQLLEMVAGDEHAAGILAGDLANNKEMSLVHAERQIKAWVDKNHKGNVGVCTPKKAEEILRAFYGLGEAASAGGNAAGNRGLQSTAKDELDLEDFL